MTDTTRPNVGKRPLDAVAERIAKTGDAVELHGPLNEFGGRPVIACIEREGAGFRVWGKGRTETRRTTLAEALADVGGEHGERDDWSFVSGLGDR